MAQYFEAIGLGLDQLSCDLRDWAERMDEFTSLGADCGRLGGSTRN